MLTPSRSSLRCTVCHAGIVLPLPNSISVRHLVYDLDLHNFLCLLVLATAFVPRAVRPSTVWALRLPLFSRFISLRALVVNMLTRAKWAFSLGSAGRRSMAKGLTVEASQGVRDVLPHSILHPTEFNSRWEIVVIRENNLICDLIRSISVFSLDTHGGEGVKPLR